MKAVALIYNKNERAVSRPHFTDFSVVSTPATLDDGIREIKGPTPIDLIVLDERFDDALKIGDQGLRVMDFLGDVQNTNSSNAVIVVIVSEAKGGAGTGQPENLERIQAYSDMGVDMFLNRPFGLKELQEKLKEAKTWIQAPPPWVQLMRVSRSMIKAGDYQKAAYGLQKLFELKADNVTVGLLLARCLINMDKTNRDKGVAILKVLEQKFPASVLTKKLLFEAAHSAGDRRGALDAGLKLFKQQGSSENFKRCIDLAGEISKETGDVEVFVSLMAMLKAQGDPARSKDARMQTLQGMIRTVAKPIHVMACVKFVNDSADIKLKLREDLSGLLSRMEDRSEDPYADVEYVPGQLENAMEKTAADAAAPGHLTPTDEAREALLRCILDMEPGEPAALEALVRLAMTHDQNELAWQYLDKAREAKKFTLEYYLALASVALKEQRLKEASDAIHSGKRLAPSDERLENLGKRWAQLYNEQQEKQKTG